MSLETVKVSQQAKEQLSRIKRFTGIKQWNILCRWALCTSLADTSPPLVRHINTDSNVEMTWKTFTGPNADVYVGLLRKRCYDDGLEPTDSNVSQVLTSHLHRGIGYLAGGPSVKSVEGLVGAATD